MQKGAQLNHASQSIVAKAFREQSARRAAVLMRNVWSVRVRVRVRVSCDHVRVRAHARVCARVCARLRV